MPDEVRVCSKCHIRVNWVCLQAILAKGFWRTRCIQDFCQSEDAWNAPP